MVKRNTHTCGYGIYIYYRGGREREGERHGMCVCVRVRVSPYMERTSYHLLSSDVWTNRVHSNTHTRTDSVHTQHTHHRHYHHTATRNISSQLYLQPIDRPYVLDREDHDDIYMYNTCPASHPV